MSVPACTALVPDNRLYGTAGDDKVRISKADGADGLAGKFKVEINGEVRVMTQKELEATRFELGAGNDTVHIDADVRTKGFEINGGTGTLNMTGATKQVANVTGRDNEPLPKPFRIPGTMLTVIPLEAAKKGESLKLFGMELPFRSARITNESCFTALPPAPKNAQDVQGALNGKVTQPGQPTQSVPHFNVTVSADRARVDVTDRVPLSLHPKEVPGTPLGGKVAEGNLRRNEVINPSIAFGERMVLTGTVSLRDPYPAHYVSPTELDITLTSENFKTIRPKQHGDRLDIGQVGKVKVEAFGVAGAQGGIRMSYDLTRIDVVLEKQLGLKPAQADAMRQEIVDVLKAKFDQLAKNHGAFDLMAMFGPNGDLQKSLQPVFDKYTPPEKRSQIPGAMKSVLDVLSHPGLTVQGPMYMGVPVGYGYFNADSTQPMRAPLEGSGIGLPFPATLAMAGPMLIPAGTISENKTPGAGGLYARDWNSFGVSVMAAGKPTLEPQSMGVAGVVAGRATMRLGGFDVTAEIGWRGRASLGGGGAGAGGDAVRSGLDQMGAARDAAVRRAVEAAEGHERGSARPDYVTPQVLGNDLPRSEGYIGVTVKRQFKGL